MGLYGVIAIYPSSSDYNTFGQTAYGGKTGTAYDVEKILVLSEIDSRYHAALNAGQPFNLVDYNPDYWLINGRSFPYSVLPDQARSYFRSQPVSAKIAARPGQKVLIRCINAGSQNHTFRLEGITAQVVAVDSRPLFPPGSNIDARYYKNTITIASGESYDLIIDANAYGQYYLHDRDLHHLCNANNFPGGMSTCLEVQPSLPTTKPLPPILSGSSLGSSYLSWKAQSQNEEGFIVERLKIGETAFKILAVLPAAHLTAFLDQSVEPYNIYLYRVVAYNAKGLSGYSNLHFVFTWLS